jgi:Thiol:disulfide interchange protein DsbD, N-terminal
MSRQRSTLIGVGVIILVFGIHAIAQRSSPDSDLERGLGQSDSRVETRHLTVTTSASAVSVQGRLTLFVDVTPKPKMHVYSPEQKDVIPVTLTVSADGLRISPTKFPKPEKYYFAPLKETQFVYSRPFRLALDATLVPTLIGGSEPLTIKGMLRYQACDDAICYLPQNLPLVWTVKR